MAERRVAITGMGVVTPVALGADEFWKALIEGRSGARTIALFDASGFPCTVGAELGDFSARTYVPKSYRKAVKVMARDIEVAVAAADLAFRNAGLTTRGTDESAPPTVEPKRLGCNVGAGLICADLDELGAAVTTAVTDGAFDLKAWGSGGMNNLTPLWLLKYLPNMLACHVTIIHAAEGPSNTITCGDASGLLSIGEAGRWVQRGHVTAAVAGGAEAKRNPMGQLRQQLLGRLCTTANDSPAAACRPFDAQHAGTVIGEGGGLIILEDLEHARSRGAKIYAELVGFGGACDPQGIDIMSRTAGGLDLAVRNALNDAELQPADVSALATHGTAVPDEDAAECAAWTTALGDAAAQRPAFSITGATGSLFAGAGGTLLAAAALALHHQIVPPTVNFSSPADGCNLQLASQPRQAELTHIVVGGFAIGGQSAACVLRRYVS